MIQQNLPQHKKQAAKTLFQGKKKNKSHKHLKKGFQRKVKKLFLPSYIRQEGKIN